LACPQTQRHVVDADGSGPVRRQFHRVAGGEVRSYTGAGLKRGAFQFEALVAEQCAADDNSKRDCEKDERHDGCRQGHANDASTHGLIIAVRSPGESISAARKRAKSAPVLPSSNHQQWRP
jgi:hypothetical protein